LLYHTGWTSYSYLSTCTLRDWVAFKIKCLYYDYYFSLSRHSSEWNLKKGGRACPSSCVHVHVRMNVGLKFDSRSL
jgi:hypothetical protein